jgi:protease I
MELALKGRRVAILAADGMDGPQLSTPRRLLADAGATPEVLAARPGVVSATSDESIPVDRTFDDCHAADYDALVIPGGEGTAALSRDERVVQLVREFMAADKPVAAIGAGVRLLVVADMVAGRAIAATADVAEEVQRAGGRMVDGAIHVDERLITARSADATVALVGALTSRVEDARADELSEQSFPASDPPPGPVSVGGEGASRSLHLDPQASDT